MEPKQEKPIRPYNDQDDRYLFDNEESVASATDCTGMIPTPPVEEAEVNSYSEIFDIPLARDEVPKYQKEHPDQDR